MLFKAKIDNSMIQDVEDPSPINILEHDNALCKQLYIFLNCYVPRRLIYENESEHEDCIQETIMYMLQRIDKLTKEEKETINIEKFLYNRAHSYISLYIRGMTRRRDIYKKYKVHKEFVASISNTSHNIYIDIGLLKKVIDGYPFDEKRKGLTTNMVINKLITIGYKDTYVPILDEDIEKYDNSDILSILSYAIVDEYLLRSAEDRGGIL